MKPSLKSALPTTTIRILPMAAEKDLVLRTVKQVREKNMAEDEALLKELTAEGVDDATLVCETNRRFIRGHYANDVNLPKAR